MNHLFRVRPVVAFGATVVAAGMAACGTDGTLVGGNAVGGVNLALQVGTSAVIDTVDYVITGPASYSKSGSIDVSGSSTLSARLSAIPQGTGYSIALTAVARGGGTTCAGSAPFDVTANQTTPVDVHLTCTEGARTGSILVNGTLNICPIARILGPFQSVLGTTTQIVALAQDIDGAPSPLTYHWTGTNGTLMDPSVESPMFTCADVGPALLTLTVSDGDISPGCAAMVEATVNCILPEPDGGAGTGGAPATGGAASTGGLSGTGGDFTGGSPGTGGDFTGGSPGTGGDFTGGSPGTGGDFTGGSPGTGGDFTGGSPGTGGLTGTGGESTGGTPGTGGLTGTGGESTGGLTGTGGESTGGTPNTGGFTGTGGQSTGGTPGIPNVVVYRVGSGTGTLVNTGNPVFIDEYSSTGALARTTPLPTSTLGSNHRLVASGTATSEGLISRSADGKYVLITGYDSSIPAAASLAGTTGTAVPRTVGLLDASGTLNTETALTDFASGNNPRSAASTNGQNLWFCGGAGGIRFAALAASTSVQLSTTVTNLRQTSVFGSQLFVSTASGSAVRLGAVGTGLPTTTGQVIVNLAGIPLTGSPYGFFVADLNPSVPGDDVLYIADDAAAALTKYSLVSGSWVANGTIGTASDAYRGVTGSSSGGVVTLYAARKGGSTGTGGGELVLVVDSGGYNGAFDAVTTLLATASANTAFRGVALAPNP